MREKIGSEMIRHCAGHAAMLGEAHEKATGSEIVFGYRGGDPLHALVAGQVDPLFEQHTSQALSLLLGDQADLPYKSTVLVARGAVADDRSDDPAFLFRDQARVTEVGREQQIEVSRVQLERARRPDDTP